MGWLSLSVYLFAEEATPVNRAAATEEATPVDAVIVIIIVGVGTAEEAAPVDVIIAIVFAVVGTSIAAEEAAKEAA